MHLTARVSASMRTLGGSNLNRSAAPPYSSSKTDYYISSSGPAPRSQISENKRRRSARQTDTASRQPARSRGEGDGSLPGRADQRIRDALVRIAHVAAKSFGCLAAAVDCDNDAWTGDAESDWR